MCSIGAASSGFGIDLDRRPGRRRCLSAVSRTQSGTVAEKSAVCRAGVVRARIRSTSGREAAVEHLVGLVEDEEADLVQPERALVEQVEHAAGRADDDVGALAEHRRAAGPSARPPKIRPTLTPLARAELLEHAADLDGQLAGRGQHQHLDAALARVDAARWPGCRRRASCRSRCGPGRSRRGRRAAAASASAWIGVGVVDAHAGEGLKRVGLRRIVGERGSRLGRPSSSIELRNQRMIPQRAAQRGCKNRETAKPVSTARRPPRCA